MNLVAQRLGGSSLLDGSAARQSTRQAGDILLDPIRWIAPRANRASLYALLCFCGRRGGLMVSALVSGLSGPGSSPGRGHCLVFLGKTLYSYSASLHPGPGCSKPDQANLGLAIILISVL